MILKKMEFALGYAKNNLPLIPVHSIVNGVCSCFRGRECPHAGKHPLTQNGISDATTDELQISEWFAKYPFANIGLLTGKKANFFAFDVDQKSGGYYSLEDLHNEFGGFPETPYAQTGGGGQHFLFAYPNSGFVRSRTAILPGIDIKSDRGYIIVEPSLHISGQKYTWKLSPEDIPFAPPPTWLLQKINSQSEASSNSSKDLLSLALAQVTAGNRNVTMTRFAGLLLRTIHPRLALELCLCLNKVKFQPPLSEDEILTIFNSISRKELSKRGFTGKESI